MEFKNEEERVLDKPVFQIPQKGIIQNINKTNEERENLLIICGTKEYNEWGLLK